jgi:hypothetical protein
VLPEDTSHLDWQKALFDVATLVDTSLFRAYMLARPALAGSLFRLDNFCDPDVVNAKLYESGRYGDLIDFLHGKKLHREALEVLAKFGKNEAKEEAATDDLRGPQRSVGYLQQLPPELIDLILEFAEWPLKEDADLGMQIFLADTENAETLPRHRVLDFLQKIDSKLAVKYLEHIIYELDDTTPEYHQRLLDLYLERLNAKDGGFANDEDRLEYRTRLERLLKSSSQYNRARALARLPNSGGFLLLYHRLKTMLTKATTRSRTMGISCNSPLQNGQPQTSPPNLRVPNKRLRKSRRLLQSNLPPRIHHRRQCINDAKPRTIQHGR